MEETLVQLNDDQKAVLGKALKQIRFATSQLEEWALNDRLPEKMAGTLPSLIEDYFGDIASVLNYESYLVNEAEKRYEKIRKANETIHELREQLGSSKPVDGLPEQLKHLSDTVRDWWNEEGFHYVSDTAFYPHGGMEVKFGFMLDHFHSYSKTPETDKRTKQEQIQYLREQGYEFADFETDQSEKLHLIDNPHNRKLLTNFLRTRFPSIDIRKWDNYCSRNNQDVFLLRYVEAFIDDFTEI